MDTIRCRKTCRFPCPQLYNGVRKMAKAPKSDLGESFKQHLMFVVIWCQSMFMTIGSYLTLEGGFGLPPFGAFTHGRVNAHAWCLKAIPGRCVIKGL